MSEPTMPEVPFATLEDLANRGRPTSEDDKTHVETLLSDASQMLIDEMPRAVARANPETLKRIVCEMVKEAVDTGDSMPGAESTQFGVGPFQQSYKWANPTGALFIKKAHRRALRGPQRAFTVSTMPEGAGSEYPAPGGELL